MSNRQQKFKKIIRRMVKEEVRNAFSSFKSQLKQEILNEVNMSGGGQTHVRNINQRRQQSQLGRQAGQRQRQTQQGGFSQQADNMITEYNQQGGQKQMLRSQYRDVMQGQMGAGQNGQPEQGSIPIDEGLAKRWGELNNKLKNKKNMNPAGGGAAQGPSASQVKNSWKPGMFNDKDSLSEDAKRKLREANKKGGNGKQQLNG